MNVDKALLQRFSVGVCSDTIVAGRIVLGHNVAVMYSVAFVQLPDVGRSEARFLWVISCNYTETASNLYQEGVVDAV